MSLFYLLPVLLLLGIVYFIVMSRRHHGRIDNTGTEGRPDETEPPGLSGPEQHRHRDG